MACIGVYGADQPQRAEALGIALQLINVMRDVREDWQLGRVYLPQDELASFGVAEGGHRRRPAHSRLAGVDGIPVGPGAFLPRGGTDAARLPRPPQLRLRRPFASLYAATLERIEARGFDVFDGPPRLSALTKLRIVAANLV